MVVYADTSFLVCLYGTDTHHERAAGLASRLTSPLPCTALQWHETRNAFRLASFRGEITPEECRAVLRCVEDDLRTGALTKTSVAWSEVFDAAEAISESHTATMGSRGVDVLHIAAASALGAEAFYTFDARQKALAARLGLDVAP